MLSLGVLISILISTFLDEIILFLGGRGDIFPYAKDYLSVLILFCICYMTGYGLEIYIKVDGKPSYPTFSVLVGGITNLVLDYIFVVKFHWGIKGAAFATGISQVTTTSLLFFYIFFMARQLKFVKIKLSIVKIARTIYSFTKKGIAEFLAEISMGISLFIFNRIIMARIGESGVSAFTIIGYVTSFVTMTMIGFSQGVQPLISFNLGAENHIRIKKIFRISMTLIFFIQIFFYAFINLMETPIVSAFLNDEKTIIQTGKALRLYSLSYLISGFNLFTAGYFTSMNKAKISSIITLLRGILLLVLFLYTLPEFIGSNGIWLSVFATEFVTLFVSYYFLREYLFKRKFIL